MRKKTMKNGLLSAEEQAQADRDITSKFPPPSLEGKEKILVMPEKAIFYCRPDQYPRLAKKLIAKYKRSKITKL